MDKTLSKGWEMVRLGEVADYINGKAFKPSDWSDTGVPIIRIQNLTDTSKPFNYYQGECESKYHINNGDILISWSASLGTFVWDRDLAYLNQHIFKTIPKLEIINKRFFVYVMSTVIESMKRQVHGATMKHIVKSEFNNITIPLPPLSTQKRIVEILEEADGLRKLRKEADEKMKDLIPSLFVKMFGDPATNPKGWEVKKLGEVCDVRDGTHDTPKYYQSGIPLITSKNLVGDILDFENVRYISEQDHKKIIQRSFVEKGDILFAMIGTIGNPVIVETEEVFSIKNVALFKFEKATYLINYYLKCLLSNQNVIMELAASAKGGNQKFVSLKMLRTLKIPLPPLPLQQEFAARVEEIEAEKARQAKSKAKLDDLFNSLMQKAFKGELVA